MEHRDIAWCKTKITNDHRFAYNKKNTLLQKHKNEKSENTNQFNINLSNQESTNKGIERKLSENKFET